MTRSRVFSLVLALLAPLSGVTGRARPVQGDAASWDVAPAKPELGPMSEVLRQRESTWDVTIEMQTSPKAAMSVSKGTQTNRLAVGGAWLLSDFEGEMGRRSGGGHPLIGHAITGFDPQKAKYVGVWVDSEGRHITLLEGTYDSAKKTFRMTSLEKDAKGKVTPVTGLARFTNPDTEVVTIFSRGPDGKAIKSMTTTYRRRP
jgi:hypothetical protein